MTHSSTAARAGPVPAFARHWALPVLLLAGHFAASAVWENDVYLVGVPLLLFAAFRLWTGFGRRPFFGINQLVHPGARNRRDHIALGASMVLSLLLAFAALARVQERGQEPAAADPAAALMLDAMETVLSGATEEREAVNAIQQIHVDALQGLLAELEDPNLTQERRDLVAARVDLIRAESRQVCRLFLAGDLCQHFDMSQEDVVSDPAARDAIVGGLREGAREIEQWR